MPHIDKKACIDCGHCEKVCSSLQQLDIKNNTQPRVIGCFHMDNDIIKKSSSGGAFSAIANHILNLEGVVFGAVMGKDLRPYQLGVTHKSQLQELRGSKYLQSHHRNTYREAKSHLEKNRYVLYVGCPCQIAGLYSYLEETYQTLTTVDLVCHGVGSQSLFDRYSAELSKKYGYPIEKIEFRNKEKYKDSYTLKITFFGRDPVYIKAYNDIYMNCFFRCAIYRESCYRCPYAKLPRIADFTIGDFVGIDRFSVSKKSLRDGVSVMLLNNDKAEILFSDICGELHWVERPLQEATDTNLNIIRPTIRPKIRDYILKETDMPAKQVRDKYCKISFVSKLAGKMSPQKRDLLKRILHDKH